MDVDQVLTDHPDAMVRIAPETTQLLKTAPVELIYTGARDQPVNGLYNCQLSTFPFRPRRRLKQTDEPFRVEAPCHELQRPRLQRLLRLRYAGQSDADGAATAYWSNVDDGRSDSTSADNG